LAHCATSRRGNADTLAYVVMPDHLHWLLVLGKRLSLSKVLANMKGFSAACINAEHRMRGRLWQPGFHDHGVRAEEDLRVLARYVIANPVRAGLVQSVRDYPHWDAVWV
jgi:REP element-mobilizing transposase RayT